MWEVSQIKIMLMKDRQSFYGELFPAVASKRKTVLRTDYHNCDFDYGNRITI